MKMPLRVRPGVYDTNPETATEFPHGPDIVAANDEIVASLPLYAEDYAALIVRAVNAYPQIEAMRKALEEARSELIFKFLQSAGRFGVGLTWVEYTSKYGVPSVIAQIDAALSESGK